ncbi:hypothetical protein ACLOJK_003883 [Asimina triloba]
MESGRFEADPTLFFKVGSGSKSGLTVWAGKQIGADRRGRWRVWAGTQVRAGKNVEKVRRSGEEGRASTEAMAGLGGDGRMRGLGRCMGEEKRRGLGGSGRLVTRGDGRAGKTAGRGEEKGTRGQREAGRWRGREGWETTRERRREGDDDCRQPEMIAGKTVTGGEGRRGREGGEDGRGLAGEKRIGGEAARAA